jgi:hypothetical protein
MFSKSNGGGGDGGGRKFAGETGYSGSRKGKRNIGEEDDGRRQRKNYKNAIPDEASLKTSCPCCDIEIPQGTLESFEVYEQTLYNGYGGDGIVPRIRRLPDGRVYHRYCVCASCNRPGDRLYHIYFTKYSGFYTRIPYNCPCLSTFSEAVKRHFFVESTAASVTTNFFAPYPNDLFAAPIDELVDFLKMWGKYINPHKMVQYERAWRDRKEDGPVPIEYRDKTVAQLIEGGAPKPAHRK